MWLHGRNRCTTACIYGIPIKSPLVGPGGVGGLCHKQLFASHNDDQPSQSRGRAHHFFARGRTGAPLAGQPSVLAEVEKRLPCRGGDESAFQIPAPSAWRAVSDVLAPTASRHPTRPSHKRAHLTSPHVSKNSTITRSLSLRFPDRNTMRTNRLNFSPTAPQKSLPVSSGQRHFSPPGLRAAPTSYAAGRPRHGPRLCSTYNLIPLLFAPPFSASTASRRSGRELKEALGPRSLNRQPRSVWNVESAPLLHAPNRTVTWSIRTDTKHCH